MSLVSGKALWSIICGQSVLASDEVVGEELETATKHLQEGLSFYKQWSEETYKSWCAKSKKDKHDFVYKVGTLLDVDAEQAWEIFQLFLQYEYKGSAAQLQAAAASDREESMLLHQIFSFYMCDPLHLLSCRRHILSGDSSHPYEKLFKDFISEVLDPDQSLGTKLISQLRNMTAKLLKSQTVSPHLPPNATQARISFLLSGIKHQLATLLVYYGTPGKPCSPDAVRSLLLLAQGIGLGRDLIDNVGRHERNSFMSQLEAIDAFHCFLITLLINADSDPTNHILCTPDWISRINPMIQSMGSKPWHYPPILAWAILQGRRVANDSSCSAEEASKYSHLVQRAIKGNVFGYLQSSLKNGAFETDQLLKVIGASITFSLICIVGTCIDLEKINLMPQVHQLAHICLVFEPTSHFFWSEGGSEASVLLPSALESFPHSPAALLDILTALASANKSSSSKVVELLKELESFTWPLIVPEGASISISGNQCVTRSDLFPLPGFIIPKDSQGLILNVEVAQNADDGRIVCWQLVVNGWNVLLSSFQFLLDQINSGVRADAWSLDIVVRGLRLLSALLKSDLEHAFLLQDHENVARQLFISVSQVSKPDYNLVSALLEFFAEHSRFHCTALWNDIDGCVLLPLLPKGRVGKKLSVTDLLMNYRAGNIRSLICGIEANSGNFSVLTHLCSLVEIAVKNGLNHSSIRGTVVFVVKEVIPVMLLWRSTDVSSRIELFERVFSLMHYVLEDSCTAKDLQELVVLELSNAKGGAGSTLKSILESSANLQTALDQPAEWPHSSHARKLTKMAKLALSLAHRLVGQYLTSGERLREFFLEGSSHAGGRMSHGVWVAHKPPHLALTIAHFVYHRLNPRLPYLALRTLTRLAKEMGVPLVACLGSEAEGLRDCLLYRLDFDTEDLWVKVATLRLLTIATPLQPGLIRLFLTPPQPLLDSVVSLIQQHKQNKSEAGTELLLSLVELASSLWDNNLTTATAYLKEKDEFWDGLSFCLCNKEPGEASDDVVGGIFKIYALEFYESQSQNEVCEKFQLNLKKLISPADDKFSSWIKYSFLTYIENKTNVMDSNSEGNTAEGCNLGMLENFCQFLTIVLTKSSHLLSDKHKNLLGVCVIESLLNLFENDAGSCDALQVLLSEIHLALLSHCSRLMVENSSYTSCLSRLLATLRSSVMQTRAKSQVMVLAATLKALASPSSNVSVAEELHLNMVSSAVLLVEQHCALASSFSEDKKDNSTFDFSSSACLALACTLLYRCMETLPQDQIEDILESSHLTYALLQAAVKHTEIGNVMVVREIQRLLSLIARRTSRMNDLSTNSLAVSVSLVLASQKQFDLSILRDLLWCTTYCLKKEGSSGLEGAVSLVAVHLTPITSALTAPDTQADLALAAASLAATLAPYHQLWRVIHQECFEQLVTATAYCIHRATKMLHLKETLEREICGEKKSVEGSSEKGGHSATPLSQRTIILINQLLQILSTCLETVLCLTPNVTELLCCPGIDMNSCTFDLVQPSIRRQSGEQIALPNLATLADVLDLFHIFVPKEGRYSSPMRNTQSTARVDLPLLTHCVEEALLLFITYSALLIMSPNVQVREARDVRTFLADETSSFFNHWIGRRSVAAASPLPPLSPKLPLSDLPYFILCRQVVSSLCNPRKS